MLKMLKYPVIIMVWMQDPLAGLGDLLRGTTHLHALSQKLNFQFIVDIQLHPISKFLVPIPHEYSDYVVQNKDKIINLVNESNGVDVIKNYLMNPESKTKPILLISNNIENLYITPTPSTKLLIRSILNPIEEFKTQFNSMCSEFKISKNYSILHLRLGDDELVRNNTSIEKYSEYLKIIDANVEPNNNTIIIADSFGFKQYLRNVRPHLANRIVPTQPIHLSHSNDSDDRKIKETLFDLFLLIHSKTIKTYTVYTWISGFVQWISHAFNIPLFSINHNIQFMTSEKTTTPRVTFRQSPSTVMKPTIQMTTNIHASMTPKNPKLKVTNASVYTFKKTRNTNTNNSINIISINSYQR